MSRPILYAMLVLLAFCLPFEALPPVVVLPGLRLTNLEALTLLTLAAWLAHRVAAADRRPSVEDRGGGGRQWVEMARNPFIWAPAALLALTILSAGLAPSHRLEALKLAGRLGTGILVFWMMIDCVRSRSLSERVQWAIVLGAGLSALLGLAEAAGWTPAMPMLAWFKEAPTRVGGVLRVSASFQYATMAAGFFEMAVVVAVSLAATATTRRSRWTALAVATVATADVVLASSRAGMVALAVALGSIVALAWRVPRMRPAARPALLALGALVAFVAALGWRTETFRTRLVTEDDLGWYAARYAVPSSLDLELGEATRVTVGVKNTGVVRWNESGSNPFALGYYWQTGQGKTVGGGHVEVPLPRAVGPGDSVGVEVPLRPDLSPGEYDLVWGMLQHRILWFRHRNVPEARTEVRVVGDRPVARAPVDTTDVVPGGAAPDTPPTIRRRDLWTAALRMWGERPLLGVGPGNFRHLYGEVLGLSDWDRRIHSNNLYLEWLVGWGLLGTLAFAVVVLLIARRWVRLVRTTVGSDAVRILGLGAALGAFFVHGLLDYFLAFTPHYLLFWTIAGLVVSARRWARAEVG